MKVGVVVFPGSNCEHDVVEAVTLLGGEAELVWHGDRALGDVDAVVLPGGFAHGDYLRPGAIARFSPVMEAVVEFAHAGGPVVGICNGFQVLTEAGLLPGALQKNRGLKFLCTTVAVRVESTESALTSRATAGAVLRLPINHFEGNYTCSARRVGRIAGRRPGHPALSRQPQRVGRRHRRHLFGRPERMRADAAPGTGVRHPARVRGRRPLLESRAGRRGGGVAASPVAYSAPRLMPALRSTPGSTPAWRQAA